jgi:hypothetical protein
VTTQTLQVLSWRFNYQVMYVATPHMFGRLVTCTHTHTHTANLGHGLHMQTGVHPQSGWACRRGYTYPTRTPAASHHWWHVKSHTMGSIMVLDYHIIYTQKMGTITCVNSCISTLPDPERSIYHQGQQHQGYSHSIFFWVTLAA